MHGSGVDACVGEQVLGQLQEELPEDEDRGGVDQERRDRVAELNLQQLQRVDLAAVPVQVLTPGGNSNTVSLTVTTRQGNGRVKWRFQHNDMYTVVRPAVGPDGTVYVVDVGYHLYALSPDGALKWIVRGAGAEGSPRR